MAKKKTHHVTVSLQQIYEVQATNKDDAEEMVQSGESELIWSSDDNEPMNVTDVEEA